MHLCELTGHIKLYLEFPVVNVADPCILLVMKILSEPEMLGGVFSTESACYNVGVIKVIVMH